MNLSTVVKAFQYQLLTGAGIAVTPEQLGLKVTNPSALPGGTTGINGAFSQYLNNQQTNLTAPTPPTPPVDSTNVEEQTRYQQELLTYNQKFQQYHLQMMQQMNNRFLQLQQTMQSNSSKSSSSLSSSNSGVGGILDSNITVPEI